MKGKGKTSIWGMGLSAHRGLCMSLCVSTNVSVIDPLNSGSHSPHEEGWRLPDVVELQSVNATLFMKADSVVKGKGAGALSSLPGFAAAWPGV